jgi:transcriptional regulator with XRE-family HTH domain
MMRRLDPVLRSFGQNVAKRRAAKGLSQEAVAEKADLDRTYLSDIERGARNPGISNVVRLAKALGVTASWVRPLGNAPAPVSL